MNITRTSDEFSGSRSWPSSVGSRSPTATEPLARIATAGAKAMEPQFRALVDAHLDAALSAGRLEWMGQLAEPLPMVMVARILGLPDDDAPRLKDQGSASVEAIGGFVSDERLAELGERMTDVGPVAEA